MARFCYSIPQLLLLFFSIPCFVLADDTPAGQAIRKITIALPSSLPTCINDQKTFEWIENTQNANKNNSHRYDGYRKALKASTEVELFTRLAYAETLGTNCANKNAEVSSLIVNVIGNRVMKRTRNISSVIFERAQFASSLHIYSNSRYKDFLCPQDKSLWIEVGQKVKAILHTGAGDLSSDTVNYFLYKHDSRWTKEPWNLQEDAVSAAGSARECIRTFRNHNWR